MSIGTEPKEHPSIEEMLAAHEKWWGERNEGLSLNNNLLVQQHLLNTVSGLIQDVTFLLRYVHELSHKIEEQD